MIEKPPTVETKRRYKDRRGVEIVADRLRDEVLDNKIDRIEIMLERIIDHLNGGVALRMRPGEFNVIEARQAKEDD